MPRQVMPCSGESDISAFLPANRSLQLVSPVRELKDKHLLKDSFTLAKFCTSTSKHHPLPAAETFRDPRPSRIYHDNMHTCDSHANTPGKGGHRIQLNSICA